MGIPVIDNFQLAVRLPIDSRAVFSTTAEALSEIKLAVRYKGLQVFITSEEKMYWFKTGTSNADFIEMDSGGSGGWTSIKLNPSVGLPDIGINQSLLLKLVGEHYMTYNGQMLFSPTDYEIDINGIHLKNFTVDGSDELRLCYCTK